MKLEDQVVSLELAKKLKELGVEQNGLFVWRGVPGWPFGPVEYKIAYSPSIIDDTEFPPHWKKLGNKVVDVCAAYTVAELGEMLPIASETSKRGTQWHCLTHLCGNMGIAETEADARAKMLIYLLENNLITL